MRTVGANLRRRWECASGVFVNNESLKNGTGKQDV